MKEEDASKKINDLERERYKERFEYIGNYISYEDSKYNEKVTEFMEFMKSTFQIDLEGHIDYFNKPKREPTDEEIDKIRKIIGFEFYYIVEFQEESYFYVPKLNPKIFRNSEKAMTLFKEYNIITFYTTYKEALDKICYHYYNSFAEDPLIYGKPEELSSTPELLNNLIDNNRNIFYLENEIKFKRGIGDTLALINDVLTEKPIIIERKTIEEIENTEQNLA